MPAPRVFVSHSHQDDVFTAQLVADLQAAGVQVWVDVADIRDGNFMQRINDALAQSEWLVLVQTPAALASPAVRMEVDAAINMHLYEQMRGVIPIIAAPYDVASVPPTWRVLHYYDATHDYATALRGLLHALGALAPGGMSPSPSASTVPFAANPQSNIPTRLSQLGFVDRHDSVSCIIPPIVAIPAGEFTMGSAAHDAAAQAHEQPQFSISVGSFSIGVYPVTVAEYARAVAAGAVPAPPAAADNAWGWQQQQQHPDHPVVGVAWGECRAYCQWLATATGQPWRLPTEADWEKAARWDAANRHARIYPWGDTWDETRANTLESAVGGTTPIGAYAAQGDTSPYGCHDMAGNIWEWTSTLWYDRPPYHASYEEGDITRSDRVLHGGSSLSYATSARAAARFRFDAALHARNVGLRLSMSDTGAK